MTSIHWPSCGCYQTSTQAGYKPLAYNNGKLKEALVYHIYMAPYTTVDKSFIIFKVFILSHPCTVKNSHFSVLQPRN